MLGRAGLRRLSGVIFYGYVYFERKNPLGTDLNSQLADPKGESQGWFS